MIKNFPQMNENSQSINSTLTKLNVLQNDEEIHIFQNFYR